MFKCSILERGFFMMESIIAAIISAIAAIVVGIFGIVKNKDKKQKLEKLSTQHAYANFLDDKIERNIYNLLHSLSRISMFTVNSFEMKNRFNVFFERNKALEINELDILVRKKSDESESDKKILDDIVAQWIGWYRKDRIKKLKIVSYDHDPEQFYTVFGDKIMFSGQVFFDSTKPTGTNINYSPVVYNGDSEDGLKIIKMYRKHFDNILAHYEKKGFVLFNSEDC